MTRPRYGYLSGPMSGLPAHNFPAFFDAERVLNGEGIGTMNPARLQEMNPPPTPLMGWAAYIKRDMAVFMSLDIDAVFMLSGWEKSRGATLEAMNATALGIPCIDFMSRQIIAGADIAAAMVNAFGLGKPDKHIGELTPSAARGKTVPWARIRVSDELRAKIEAIAAASGVEVEALRGRGRHALRHARMEIAVTCHAAGYTSGDTAAILGCASHSCILSLLKDAKELASIPS